MRRRMTSQAAAPHEAPEQKGEEPFDSFLRRAGRYWDTHDSVTGESIPPVSGPTPAKAGKQHVEFDYNGNADILFASTQPVPPTTSEPIAVDLFLLHHEQTDEVVGLECLDFSRHAQDAGWLASLPSRVLFQDAVTGGSYTAKDIVERVWLEVRRRAGGKIDQGVVLAV